MYRSFSSAIFAGLIEWEGRYLLIICNSKLCNLCVFNEVTWMFCGDDGGDISVLVEKGN